MSDDFEVSQQEQDEADAYIQRTIDEAAERKKAEKKEPARAVGLYAVFAWKEYYKVYRHEWDESMVCIHCKKDSGDCDNFTCDPPTDNGPRGGWKDFKTSTGNFGVAMLKAQTLKARGFDCIQILNINSGKLELDTTC